MMVYFGDLAHAALLFGGGRLGHEVQAPLCCAPPDYAPEMFVDGDGQ
jgi:hypothetical protein